jgi:arylsulfatase A-like enzyme
MFSTDNGAASNSWPDGGDQPFHGEKGAGGWEGGFRVPMLVKWKGRIPAGVSTGEFMTMEDWVPTLMSWVGEKSATLPVSATSNAGSSESPLDANAPASRDG